MKNPNFVFSHIHYKNYYTTIFLQVYDVFLQQNLVIRSLFLPVPQVYIASFELLMNYE